MSKLDEMKSVSELEQHRKTLLVEVRDIHTLTTNALTRLARIQKLCSEGKNASILAEYWNGVLQGTEDEEAITATDLDYLIKQASNLQNAIVLLETKRCMFGLPKREENHAPPMNP